MNEDKKIAAVYVRVSTDEQSKEGLSLESQEMSCRKKISEDGCDLYKVIRDEGKSAGSLKRPGMQELIQLVIGRKVNIIYAVHSDRLARNTFDHLNLMHLLEENDVQIKFVNQANFENNDASAKLIGTVMASVNQFQRDITGEKVKATMHNKANEGYFPGLAPVGYKNVSYPHATERFARKVIEVDKLTSPFIKEAFKLYGTGNYNVIDVNEILHTRGFRTKTGKKVFHSKLYEILKNRFYVGELHWGDTHLLEAKHPAIIDRDLFERVQNILNSHNKHSCRKRKYEWLLAGFMWCHKHECRYTAEWHLNKKIAYYHCTKGGCGKFTEKENMENMVAEKFKTLEFSKDFVEIVLEKVKNIFYDRRESYESKRQELVNQKTAFEARMRVAENKLTSGVLEDDDFTKIRNEIKSELSLIENKIISIRREKELDVDVAQQVIGLTGNIYETYHKASPQLKRLLLGFFWNRFEVADGLIIKSHPSVLFEELIRAHKSFIKSDNSQKHSVSNNFINSDKWCAR